MQQAPIEVKDNDVPQWSEYLQRMTRLDQNSLISSLVIILSCAYFTLNSEQQLLAGICLPSISRIYQSKLFKSLFRTVFKYSVREIKTTSPFISFFLYRLNMSALSVLTLKEAIIPIVSTFQDSYLKTVKIEHKWRTTGATP